MKTLLALGIVLASVGAAADYLPERQAAEAALRAAAGVAEARDARAVQGYRSEALRQGRGEWTLSAEAGGRRSDVAGIAAETRPEWAVAAQRPLRLPARAAADRALGDALTAEADANLGEALHESGRELLALWFDWLGESSRAPLWDAHYALAETQLASVAARIRLGEAPPAEQVPAEAALVEVRLRQQQGAARARQAQARLTARFPALPVAADGDLPAPQPPSQAADAYVEAVLAHSHELERARRQVEALRAEARQAASRSGADPSLGVYYRNEAGGDEHVLGLSASLTLPGGARRSDRLALEHAAAAAQARLALLEHRLRQEAEADFAAAQAAFENWQQADRAAQALGESARLAARAYELGEGGLDQVLTARRLALESGLNARHAQVEALAADARLRLETHTLWSLDVDGETF